MAGFQRPKDAYRFGFGGLKTNDSADSMDPSKHPVAENVRSHGGRYVYTRPGYDFLFTTTNVAITSGCPYIPGDLFVGIPFSFQMVAEGGTAPYVWTITSGSLPPGITLNANTGVISGTPTTVGTYPFDITATDSSVPAQTYTDSCELAVSGCVAADNDFTDTFTRVTAGNLGPDWMAEFTAGSLVTGATLYNMISCNGTQMKIAWLSGTGSPAAKLSLIPVFFLNRQCVDGEAQFSQIEITSDNSTGANFNQYGPMCFAQPYIPLTATEVLGYSVWYNAGAGTYSVQGIYESGTSNSFSGSHTLTPGDVMRLEVTPGASSNFVELLVNGSPINSMTDSSVNRPTAGYPGIYVRAVDAIIGTPKITLITEFQGGML